MTEYKTVDDPIYTYDTCAICGMTILDCIIGKCGNKCSERIDDSHAKLHCKVRT